MSGRRTAITLAALAATGAAAPATAQARHLPPHLRLVRCVPVKTPSCRAAVTVTIGRQLQFSGRRLSKGMRVSFRWPRGALATRLDRTRIGYVARVPAGTRAGRVSVTVSDRAGRRSNAKRVRVTAPAPPPVPPAAAGGGLPPAFAGSGMWIWELPRSERGDVNAIAARAHAAGLSTVFIKSSDGATNRWAQFNPALVAALHANGLRACAWQYVYGSDPVGEASLGADAVADGADCLVIDAEKEYEGRYAQAQQYMQALRAAVGPAYPVGFTSFPYVDYHPRLPYSVFLGPGGAQANVPQVYWRTIGGTVDAVSGHTMAHNRIYGTPIAPLGQSYDSPPPADIARFRAVWGGYGSAGLSWWSWQSTGQPAWAAVGGTVFPVALPDPGWPALSKGNKGDEVVWLQQHLRAFDATLAVTSTFDTATDRVLRAFQASRSLEITGATDAPTWQAVLSLADQPAVWTGTS